MDLFLKWMTLLVLSSLSTAQNSTMNITNTTVISSTGNETNLANETTTIVPGKTESQTNLTTSSAGTIPVGENLTITVDSLAPGTTNMTESNINVTSSSPGTTTTKESSVIVTTSSPGTTFGVQTTTNTISTFSTNESSNGTTFANTSVPITIDAIALFKLEAIMSLWNELMILTGNDSRTQEWTAIANDLWYQMMTSEWNDVSVANWANMMTSLWNDVMTSYGQLFDPSWNRAMLNLWNYFIDYQIGVLTTFSTFPGTDMIPPGQTYYPGFPEYDSTGWSSNTEYGWNRNPEYNWNRNPEYNLGSYPQWTPYSPGYQISASDNRGGYPYPDFETQNDVNYVLSSNTYYSGGSPNTNDTMEVLLKQGAILGIKEKVGRGRKYFYSFKGIPFAEPPIGNRRFVDPIPASSWNGTRNGTADPPRCPQLQFYITVGDEDCLYLNVYTPMPSKGDLPVMVWIHGGSFVTGGADEYPPLPIMTKQIVLVIIQYRLGTLGFLSTEDSVLPGNLGLKDQTLALQWVKDNINDLGGDPNKITVFGQNSGAASVHLQVISPKARGLFQRAIMQSGSALGQSVIRTDHKKVAIIVGNQYNCSAGEEESFNSTILLECLQALPLKDVVAIPSLFTMIVSLPAVMTPRVDGEFLPEHPAKLLKQGLYNKVDVITGINEHEGAIVALPFLLNPWLVNELMGNFEVAGPALLSLEKEMEPAVLARQILEFYLQGRLISMPVADNFVKMISDLDYTFDHDEVVKLHAKDTDLGFKTYSYEFQYRGQYSNTDNYGPDAGTHWVTHGDDLPYFFNNRLNFLRQLDDLNTRKFMIDLWTNFALTGDPTPNNTTYDKWLPVTPVCWIYLVIDRIPYMKYYDRTTLMEFWKNLPLQSNKYLNPPNKWQNFVPTTSPPVQTCWD